MARHAQLSSLQSSNMERTLFLLKPDVALKTNEIISRLKQAGYKIIQTRYIHLSEEQATDFYQEELESPNFADHLAFMISGPVSAILAQKFSLFQDISAFVGPQNPEVGRALNPNSLRAVYGQDEIRNAVHFSENEYAAEREIHFFFPEGTLDPIPSADRTKLFLESDIYPILLQGLTELCREKPSQPATWLGEWLLENNPRTPKIVFE